VDYRKLKIRGLMLLLGLFLATQYLLLSVSTHHLVMGKSLNCQICLAVEHWGDALVPPALPSAAAALQWPLVQIQICSRSIFSQQGYSSRAPPDQTV